MDIINFYFPRSAKCSSRISIKRPYGNPTPVPLLCLYKVLLTIKWDFFVARGSLNSIFLIHAQCPRQKKCWNSITNLHQLTFQNQWQSDFKGDIVILRVALIVRITFIARFTSYFLHTIYKLLFIALVTGYFLHASYCLLHEVGATFYVQVESCN